MLLLLCDLFQELVIEIYSPIEALSALSLVLAMGADVVPIVSDPRNRIGRHAGGIRINTIGSARAHRRQYGNAGPHSSNHFVYGAEYLLARRRWNVAVAVAAVI